ncbi:MAG: HK97 gp10 family phage protein [Oscillospiraceae bacterium]|nr:HK97 gp10 family phage protein [Oscillospiraceae bacterium]
MTSIDDMTKEIMKGLQEYSELADDEMKKAVRKTATSVKKEISANAPHDTGTYAKSWTSSKVRETSHNLQMTVHSRNRYRLAHLLEKGHAKRGGGRVEGHPHIAPAEKNGEELLETLIRKAIS